MRNQGPILNMILLVGLLLFFALISTDAMARGGGGGGGGGAIGGGGGFGGGRGAGIRGAPPGSYRMRRVYSPQAPAREGGLTPRPMTAPQGPAARSPQHTSMGSPQTGGHSFVAPKAGRNYRNATEKYETLRETKHRNYRDQQPNQN